MRIAIENIGVLLHSEVKCDGITLITGKNGSGKTTFGKAFVSLFTGIKNLSSGYEEGFLTYSRELICSSLHLINRRNHVFFGSYPRIRLRSLYHLLNSKSRDLNLFMSLLEPSFDELSTSKDAFTELLINNNKMPSDFSISDTEFNRFLDSYYKSLQNVKDSYHNLSLSDNYLYQSVKDQLDYSFSGQVKNVEHKDRPTTMMVSDEFSDIMFSYDDGKIYCSETSRARDVFYLSDAGIIDHLYDYVSREKKQSLDYYLIDELKKPINRLYKVRFQNVHPQILEIINRVYPYDFLDKRNTLATNNFGINISNEAYGRKIFAIIKEMLYRNLITSDTILVFDEPDNHLHPAWQVVFAELIAEIHKEIGAKIICITHSSTLLLATQVHCKNDIPFYVYYCDKENGYNPFLDVTNNISKAHKELADPYINLDLFGSNLKMS